MSDLNYEQKSNLYQAAAIGGGSAAAAVMLLDLLRSHKRKEDAIAGKEEDTLKLYLPTPKKSLKLATQQEQLKEAGLSHMLIASLLAGGTFYGATSAYKALRKKQLEKEIADSSQQYVDTLQSSMEPGKMAGVMDAAYDLPRSIMLLSFLAGGAGTYGILENTFPKASEGRKAGMPKKIVIKNFGTVFSDEKSKGVFSNSRPKQKAENPEKAMPATAVAEEARRKDLENSPEFKEESEGEEEFAKAASISFGPRDYIKAAAFTALICAKHEMENNPLTQLLGRIVHDKSARQLRETFVATDLLGAISTSKGCELYYKQASDAQRKSAALVLFSDKLMKASAVTLLIGEMHNLHPELSQLSKAAAVSDDSCKYLLVKLAATLLDGVDEDLDYEGLENNEHEGFAEEGADELETVDSLQEQVDPVDEMVEGLAPVADSLAD